MTCPICGGPTAREARPFCSKRCADIDLGRWLRGDYALPATDAEDAGDAAGEAGREARPRH